MKITQMIKREDFYMLNEKTLLSYFCDCSEEKLLFVYPRLNAIITSTPSKKVKEYLLCEYDVREHLLKRLTVKSYVKLFLNSKGLLSDKKLSIPNTMTNDMLIYPCNKKYRIFDFANGWVDVIGKYGFSDKGLRQEIEFRTKNRLPEFVLNILDISEKGYRELIIDGKPLARIGSGFENLKKSAYAALRKFGEESDRVSKAKVYIQDLDEKILNLITDKVKEKVLLLKIVASLKNSLTTLDSIDLTFSHGDLQAGNIWIENLTDKVYIIDWETWGERSVWYDKAVLFDNLRPGDIYRYLLQNIPETEKAIVLLEDIIYQLTELNSLPSDYGLVHFNRYLKQIVEYMMIERKEVIL